MIKKKYFATKNQFNFILELMTEIITGKENIYTHIILSRPVYKIFSVNVNKSYRVDNSLKNQYKVDQETLCLPWMVYETIIAALICRDESFI